GSVGQPVGGDRVVAVGGQVGGDVGGAGGDRDRGGEEHLLPAGGGFVGEGGLGEQGGGGAPPRADVGGRGGWPLVEADAGDIAVGVGGEGHAQVDGVGVAGVDHGWGGGAEDGARAVGGGGLGGGRVGGRRGRAHPRAVGGGHGEGVGGAVGQPGDGRG